MGLPVIAFIHIKKTAGKTVKHIMRRELGLTHCDVKRWRRSDECFDAAGLRRLRRVYPRLRSIAGHSIKPYSDLKEFYPDLKYYTFLREPIARSISQYQYHMRMGRSVKGSFEEWIRDPAYHNLQVHSIAGAADLERALRLLESEVDFVGLTERLDESLALMKRALDLPDIDLSSGRINAAKDNSIRDSILADPLRVALLREANELDLELYEYAKSVIYERQKNDFGNVTEIHYDGASWKRYSLPYCLNTVYREAVYKPVIWAYRLASRG